MCGRYSLNVCVESIIHTSNETRIELIHEPRANIIPGQKAPVLLRQPDGLSVAMFKWGLVPSWATHPRIASACVHAPAESVTTALPFRAAFQRRRCAVPADGFYQWKRRGRTKVPWRFGRADGRLLLMAGLWETWADHSGGEPLQTFTILTSASNPITAPIHCRMPLILTGDAAPVWLDSQSSTQDLLAVLRPAPQTFLVGRELAPPSPEVQRPPSKPWAEVFPPVTQPNADSLSLVV